MRRVDNRHPGEEPITMNRKRKKKKSMKSKLELHWWSLKMHYILKIDERTIAVL